MAYTSPPPSAEPLLKEKPFGERTFQLSPIAVQRFRSYSTRPRGTPILIGAGLAKPDRRGNIQVDGWRLRRSGHENFPCHGAAVPPPILIQLTFTSHTGSLLLSSLKKVTSPFVPRPLLGTAAGIGKTVETFLCIYAVLYCEKVTLYPHFRDNLRGKVVDNLDNKVGITFTIHSGFPPLK